MNMFRYLFMAEKIRDNCVFIIALDQLAEDDSDDYHCAHEVKDLDQKTIDVMINIFNASIKNLMVTIALAGKAEIIELLNLRRNTHENM